MNVDFVLESPVASPFMMDLLQLILKAAMEIYKNNNPKHAY